MSKGSRKYRLVFDLSTPSELIKSHNQSYIKSLADKAINLQDLKPDPLVEAIKSTGDLFCEDYSDPIMDAVFRKDQEAEINELKEVYSHFQSTDDTTHHDDEGPDHRFSKIDYLMFSGSNKKQLISKTLGFGVIRLFIKDDEDYSEYDEGAKSDGTVLAILAVPSYFSTPDLFGFLGDEGREKVAHFRIFRSENPSRFMVLMKFRTKEDAKEFQKNNNGREFSSLEPETCQVIEVDEIKFRPNRLTSSAGILSSNASSSSFNADYPTSSSADSADSDGKYIELPTCPICLERMDTSITGLVTSSCAHTFHCMCLWKWKGGTCPVCRASSLEERKRQAGRQRRCSICSTTNNLWACLICGNIACGRYDSAHAVHHFKSTNHCYAIDLGSQSVWDYAEDRYVHRLIRNEADGKVVELPSREDKSKKLRSNSQSNKNNNDAESDKGENENEALITALLNIIQNSNEEYSEVKDEHILKQRELLQRIEELESANDKNASNKSIEEMQTQMQGLKISMTQMAESMKSDFEKQIKNLEAASNVYKLKNEELQESLKQKDDIIKKMETKLNVLETQIVPALKKSIKKHENELIQSRSKRDEIKKELEEEKELGEAMSRQLEYLKETKRHEAPVPVINSEAIIAENDYLKRVVKEKEEENQDLMFYIGTLQKVENDPELRNADIETRMPEETPSTTGKKGRKRLL